MKIPDYIKTNRYYVAISKKEALSSWLTFKDALDSYKRLSYYQPLDAKKVIGICQVQQSQKTWILLK